MPTLHCVLNDYALQGAAFDIDLTERYNVIGARFETARIGGFANGSIAIEGATYAQTREAAYDWLMRDVVFVDGAGEVAYNGFVGEISASYGFVKWRRRLDWITTQALVKYYKRHAHKRAALEKKTFRISDTDAIARYGTLERVIDLRKDGLLTQAQANQRGQVYLKRAADFIDTQFANARKATPRIELTLFGYWATLARREYILRYRVLTPVSTIIRQAIQNTGQEFVDTSTALFDLSGDATIVLNTHGERRAVQSYITDAAKYGDANYDPIIVQVLEDRRMRVASVGTSVDVLFDPLTAQVRGAGGGVVKPYLVRAGARALDMTFDGALGEDTYANANAFIVERTTYDAITNKFEFTRADPPSVEFLRRRTTKKEER